MKKLLRVLAVLVALCVLAGVLALAGSAFVVATTKDRILTLDDTPPADVDCILVLGCAGLCTYDSLYRARDIFGVKRLVIVTQEYHLYRALYLAKALGLEAWGVAADGQNYRGQTMRDLREILARDKDVLWSFFQPEPKYLGDPIPLDTAD